MKVSIVITAYKRRELLAEALASVTAQTESSFEIVVIDDASHDGTKEMLETMAAEDSRIRYESFPENRGATAARNRGLDLATGDWIMMWDSDDILDPDALRTLLEIANEHSECSVISAPARVVRAHTPVVTQSFPTGEVTCEDVLCRRLPYNVKVRMATRDAWSTVRYVSKNVDFLVNVWLRRKGKWFHTDQALGTIRMEHDAASLTSARRMPNLALSIERANHIAAYLEEEGERIIGACPSCYRAFAYGSAVGLIAGKQVRRGRLIIDTALRRTPFRALSVLLIILYVVSLVPYSHTLFGYVFHIKRSFFRLLGLSK